LALTKVEFLFRKILVEGSVIHSIKKLIRAAFPEFPSEIVDPAFQITSESDPTALFPLLTDQKVPLHLFKMSNAVLTGKQGEVEDQALIMSQGVFPEGFFKIFNSFYLLNRGNAKEGIADAAKMLEVKHEFLLLSLITVIKSKIHSLTIS
jgi:hypothetical protein